MPDLVEGRWNCPRCEHKAILGRHRACPTCNLPRTRKIKVYFDVNAPAVTDRAQLAAATAGADRYCLACAGGNSARASTCEHCGQALGAQERLLDTPSQDVAYGVQLQRLLAHVPSVLMVLSLLAYVPILWIWAVQEHAEIGEVVETRWSHVTERMTFTAVTRSDWQSGLSERPAVMPVDGHGEDPGVQRIRNCRQEVHHMETYACGTQRVCEQRSRSVACGTTESCSVSDNGNGYGTRTCSTVTRYCSESYEECRDETKYCERPIYATKCDYSTWEWRSTQVETISGLGRGTTWVELVPRSLDRIVRHGDYAVTIDYTNRGEPDRAEHAPTTLDEYLTWDVGQTVEVWVNNLGTVRSIKRGGESLAEQSAGAEVGPREGDG